MCKKKRQGGPISLHPLNPDEALAAFLDTPPPEDEGNKDRKRKKEKKEGEAEE